MINKKIFLIAGIVIIIIVLVLVFTSNQTQDEDVIVNIGWIGSLTGSATQWGEPALYAAKLALEDISSQEGIKINFIIEDSQGKSEIAVNAANKLIYKDNVKIIFTHSSTESLAVATLARENNILLFSSATSTPDYTSAGKYAFRLTPVNREGEEILKHLITKDYNKIAIFTEQAPYTLPIRKVIVDNYPGEIVFDEFFTPSTLDVRSVITKINHSNPDAIILLPFGLDSVENILRDLIVQDVSSVIYGNASFDKSEVLNLFKDNNITLYFPSLYINDDYLETKAFVKRYEDLYGSIPVKAHTLDSATKVYLIKEALDLCSLDIDCIKAFLHSINNRQTVSGIITLDENGDSEKDFKMRTIDQNRIIWITD